MVKPLTFVLPMLLMLPASLSAEGQGSAILSEGDIRQMFNALQAERDARAERYSIESAAKNFKGGESDDDVPPKAVTEKAPIQASPSEETETKQAASETQVNEPASDAPAKLNKYSKHGGGTGTTQPRQSSGGSPRKVQPAWVYVPPARQNNSGGGQVWAAESKGMYFGIQRASWIAVNLERNINSAEPGEVTLTVAESVKGRSATLPAGSTLFGQRQYNSATDRLDVSITSGITPSGQEFEITGFLYDASKVAGLDGVTKKTNIVEGSTRSGGVAAASALLSGIASDSPAGAGISRAGEVILDDQSNEAERKMRPSSVIYVNQQAGWVRLSASI